MTKHLPLQPWLLPNCASKERIEGVQPVIHVLVIDGLQQNSTVLCAHSKRVGCLQREGQFKIQTLQAHRLMHISSLREPAVSHASFIYVSLVISRVLLVIIFYKIKSELLRWTNRVHLILWRVFVCGVLWGFVFKTNKTHKPPKTYKGS